jgi:tRNA(fMet)-specific endonuclease VapC
LPASVTDPLRFLLDTNIVAALAKQPQGVAVRRLKEAGADSVAVSIIVACEVRFGLARSGSARLRKQVELVLAEIPVLPLEPPSTSTTRRSGTRWK